MGPDIVDAQSAMPVEDRSHVLKVLAQARENRREIGKNKRFVAVLFADLCDSTSYKINRGDADGLLKTYMHNSIVGDAVTRHKGDIIKYIGDEVMATFDGNSAIENAVRAAVEIQRDITIHNAENYDRSKEENIASKIGIHAGDVIMVKFPGHDAADPQGKVVDATARIISFSGPGQILCSRSVRDNVANIFQFSEPHPREAKGIQGGIEIFQVICDAQKAEEPKKLRHGDRRTTEIENLLDLAFRDELTGHIEAASNWYDQILRLDPLHFAANYRKARLEFRYRERLRVDFAHVTELARRAEESNPDSGLARTLSAIIEWSQQRHLRMTDRDGSPEFEAEQIERWAAKVRSGARLARGECDLYGELISLNALAFFLGMQFENEGRVETFNEASTICAMMENLINDFEGNLLAAFYETYARVLSFDLNNRESHDKAERLANKSLELQKSEHVYETLQRLARQSKNWLRR
jgi:class 3 adenylate cyclase